ncbi:MAG: hypothetical protein M1114_03195 [Candidatus Dependentiae bacterium]|nr:hypothetical protein [Candidatus Dependentiae bacterium]
MNKIVIMTVLTVLSILGSERPIETSVFRVAQSIFDQPEIDIELPSTNRSKKRPHSQLGDDDQGSLKRFSCFEIAEDSSDYTLSFDDQEQALCSLMFDHTDPECASSYEERIREDSTFFEGLPYVFEFLPGSVFEQDSEVFEPVVSISDSPTLPLTAAPDKISTKKDLIEDALSDEKIWKKEKDIKEGYKCLLCKTKYFPSKSKVYQHIQTNKHRVALGLQPKQPHESVFRCEICDQGFASKKNLQRHEECNYHQEALACSNNKEPFVVIRKGQSFTVLSGEEGRQRVRADALLKEKVSDKRTWEADENGYKCLLCTRSCISLAEVYAHIQTGKHRNALRIDKRIWKEYSFRCTSCNKLFTTANDLTRHKNKH